VSGSKSGPLRRFRIVYEERSPKKCVRQERRSTLACGLVRKHQQAFFLVSADRKKAKKCGDISSHCLPYRLLVLLTLDNKLPHDGMEDGALLFYASFL
jgi:hypothetical protein